MTPITQTRVGDDGNCLPACIASILEIPLSAVPELGGDDEWLDNLNGFLAGYGKRYTRVAAKGDVAPVGYHTVEGISPRGGLHACVAKDGQLVHDPHPLDGTGRGLVEPKWWGVLSDVSSHVEDAKPIDRELTKKLEEIWSSYQLALQHAHPGSPEEAEIKRLLAHFEGLLERARSGAFDSTTPPHRPGEVITLPNGKKTKVRKVVEAVNLFQEPEWHVSTVTGEVLPIPIKES